MAAIASFHLIHDHGALANLARLGRDRRSLRRTPGLGFWRLLGTGSGRDTGPSIDPRRRAVFAVWDSDAALDAFLWESPVAAGWRSAQECWSVRLRLLRGHGLWRGQPILDDLDSCTSGFTRLQSDVHETNGPICTLTRADVRLRHWHTFATSARATSCDVAAAPGLLRVVGMGEAPVGRQATFAVWENADAIHSFVRTAKHAEVMGRTREERWYGEELFARFAPYSATGTWNGEDPLATR